MEMLIDEFLRVNYGDGSGNGCGYGYEHGDCFLNDLDYGSGNGYGDGPSEGSGFDGGTGSGDGNGIGSGYDDGAGSGYSFAGTDFKSINGSKIYYIDDTPTVITHVKANIAKGYIVHADLTFTPCFIVKENNCFAHGYTLHDAFQSLQEKLYDDSTEEERIALFKSKFTDYSAKYPAKELFYWHHILTGSCRAGREAFCRDHGINLDKDTFTIYEFVSLTQDSYNGDIIKKLL